MLVSRVFRTRNIAVVIIVLILAATAYAVAAANVVGETGAGQGSGTISGYTIANVTYTLNGTDPEILDAVDFNVTATAGAAGELGCTRTPEKSVLNVASIRALTSSGMPVLFSSRWATLSLGPNPAVSRLRCAET